MNIKFIVICFIMFSHSIGFAEEIKKTDKKASGAVGLSAGWVVGNGLIYRLYQGKQMYQVTFAGLIDKDRGEEYLNLSTSYARYLTQATPSTPFGLKWIIGGEAVYDKSDNVYDNQINIGTGIGVDIGHVRQAGITISFDLIYTASFTGLKNPKFNALNLRPALGVLYNFK
ncbi:MAG: hypothetical protein L3J12_01700 [Spirochaetales bacterium]|nr:hypothetical protein [Spirochaetales bacterium]